MEQRHSAWYEFLQRSAVEWPGHRDRPAYGLLLSVSTAIRGHLTGCLMAADIVEREGAAVPPGLAAWLAAYRQTFADWRLATSASWYRLSPESGDAEFWLAMLRALADIANDHARIWGDWQAIPRPSAPEAAAVWDQIARNLDKLREIHQAIAGEDYPYLASLKG